MAGDDVPPPWRPPRLPAEHERLGLSRNTEEGAFIELASHLDRSKRSHLVIAWVLLLALGLPIVLSALQLVF